MCVCCVGCVCVLCEMGFCFGVFHWECVCLCCLVCVCVDNSIGAEGAAALGEALKSNTTVTTLDLSSKCGVNCAS